MSGLVIQVRSGLVSCGYFRLGRLCQVSSGYARLGLVRQG